MYTKVCELCGEKYVTAYSTQKYCPTCKKEGVEKIKKAFQYSDWRMEKIERESQVYDLTCEYCGREFKFPHYRRFCSPTCAAQHRAEKARCPECNKLLIECGIELPSNRMWQYCSPECAEKHRWKAAAAQGRIGKCQVCGKEFIKARKESKYCSQKCSQADASRRRAEQKTIRQKEREKETEEILHDWNRWVPKLASQSKTKANSAMKKSSKIKNHSLCLACKTPYPDCERMQSNFQYSPKGCVIENGKVITCPKYR